MGERIPEEWEHLDRANQDELAVLDHDLDERFASVFEANPVNWLLAKDAFPEIHHGVREEALRFLGSVAVRGQGGELSPDKVVNDTTLLAAAQLAAMGDEQALAAIRTNVATDVAERLFKAAHQTSVGLRMTNGRLQQQGRHLTDLHRNALEQTTLNEEMLRRTKYELHNALLFEKLHAAGILKSYDAVVFSPASTSMSQAQKKSYGFFTDTETCSIQRLSAEGDDITLESAFVAGKRTARSERHDLAAIHKLAAARGLELTTEDGTDTIQQVFLVPKEETSGVEDVVAWYDDAAGGTFYGQTNPRQDYRLYAEECRERSKGFDDIVETITAQLVRESAGFKTPMDAIVRLDELSEQLCVKRAVHDTSLDEAVFGETAAMHIQEARFFISQGQYDRAEQSMEMAQKTAESSSCPLFKEQSNSKGDGSNPNDSSSNSSEGDGEKKWMNCPYCNAKVFADPCANKISCWDCTAMVVNGKVISKGNGGSNKRRAEHQSPPPVVEQKEEVPATVPPAPAPVVHAGKDEMRHHDKEDAEAEKEVYAGSLAMAGVA